MSRHPRARGLAVKMYREWQQSNVIDETLKGEFRKACDATLNDGLDLEQVYEDQDPNFYIQSGVKRGVARRLLVILEYGSSDISHLVASSYQSKLVLLCWRWSKSPNHCGTEYLNLYHRASFWRIIRLLYSSLLCCHWTSSARLHSPTSTIVL
jgi:hypothetical protein